MRRLAGITLPKRRSALPPNSHLSLAMYLWWGGQTSFLLILESICGFLFPWTIVVVLPLASANYCGGACTRYIGSWLSALLVVACGTFVRLYLGVPMAVVPSLGVALVVGCCGRRLTVANFLAREYRSHIDGRPLVGFLHCVL